MPGRMESVENLSRGRGAGFEERWMVFHPSHRPLEIAARFPQFHSPDDDDSSPLTKGDTSIGLSEGTFLSGLDTAVRKPLHRGRGSATLTCARPVRTYSWRLI